MDCDGNAVPKFTFAPVGISYSSSRLLPEYLCVEALISFFQFPLLQILNLQRIHLSLLTDIFLPS